MTDYILFVYAEHKNQDEFVKGIAQDVALVSDSDNIKYYYGATSAIITFKSNDSVKEIHEFLKMIFEPGEIVHVLLPYNTDNMSVGMDISTFKHLFNVDDKETLSETETVAQNLYKETNNNIKDYLDSFRMSIDSDDYDYDEEEDDELKRIKNRPSEPTIDDILDKISDNGIESLTEKERKILDKYSKTI